MILNYLVSFGRDLFRDKVFFITNFLSLSVSLAIGMLSISFISDLTSYDNFQENRDHVFRIISSYKFKDDYSREVATTSNLVANSIQEHIPGIALKTILRSNFGGEYLTKGGAARINGIWGDENFFNVFTYPLIAGDQNKALTEPNSIVLTRKVALNVFKSTDVIGQMIKIDSILYVVTGVTEDVPKLSHIQFDAIAAYSGIDTKLEQGKVEYYSWYNIWSTYVYVVLEKGSNLETLDQSLKSYCNENNVDPNKKVSLSFQPMKQIALGKDLGNPIGPTIPTTAPQFLSFLSVLIILSACFNYTNLSIGRSLKRSKQVMIRKIYGASRLQVMSQFICESILVALLASVLSIPFYIGLKDWFLNVHPFISELVSLKISGVLLAQMVALVVLTGAITGIVPALHFSKVEVLKTLANAPAKNTIKGVRSFRFFIFLQFIISLALITITIIGIGQYKGIVNFRLGFATQNILNLRLQGHNPSVLANQIRQIKDVKEVSSSMLVSSIGYLYNTYIKYKSNDDSLKVYLNKVDGHYLNLYQHELIAGHNFSEDPNEANHQVIINEKFLKWFSIPSSDGASDVIGEVIDIRGEKLMIVGVAKDFNYATADRTIQPFMFLHSETQSDGYLNILINPANTPETLLAIEDKWRLIDAQHPIELSFMEDQIAHAYNSYLAIIKVTGFFAILAIGISALGIFGIVVFSIQTRLREVSIRKMLGAGQGHLFLQLSKGLLTALSISTVLILPSVYLLIDQVVLTSFAFHKSISVFDALAGGVLLWTVTLLILLSQMIRVRAVNPIVVLRTN